MKKLVKHTIVIWSEIERADLDLEDLAADACTGESYCSSHTQEIVENPKSDPDWDGTEFFGVEEE